MEVHKIVQQVVTKTITKKKKCKVKCLSEEVLQIAEERRKVKGMGGKIYQLNGGFQRIARRDKMACLNVNNGKK